MPKDWEYIRNNKWNRQRPQASAGTINQFIEEQILKKEPGKRIRIAQRAQWASCTYALRKGKACSYKGKFINPVKLEIPSAILKDRMNNNIIWKDIIGFEGRYEISNNGLIRDALNKNIIPCKREKARQVCRVKLDKKWYTVARIVAKHFLKDFEDDKKIFHIDGDITNNCVANLKIGDKMKNSFRCEYIMTTSEGNPSCRGKKIILCETSQVFRSIAEAARYVKCGASSISRCLAKLQHTAAGFHWEYV